MMEIYALPAAFYSVSSISHSLGRHFLTHEYLMNLHVTDVGKVISKKYVLINLNVHCFTAKGHCILQCCAASVKGMSIQGQAQYSRP